MTTTDDSRLSSPSGQERQAKRSRRTYVAPRLGQGQPLRELTLAMTGSFNDGGGGGAMQMNP
jgi:hypothetical protein